MKSQPLFFRAASTFMLFLFLSCSTAQAAEPPAQPPQQTVSERLSERWFEMVEIPHSMEGRQQSVDWLVAFDREFAAYKDNPDVIRIREAWLLNRQEIFHATKEDFLARLDKLPAGPGSEEAHARLLAETFPMPQDATMPVYQNYRTAMLRHQKPLLRRTYENTLDWFLAVGDGLSQVARNTVRGFGRSSGESDRKITR